MSEEEHANVRVMAYTGPHVSHRKYTPEQDAEIAEKRRAGMSMAALCREYGGSLPAMRHSLERSGLASKRTGRPAWRTFTPAQVADMAAMWADGKSQTAIALKYATTQTLISGVLKRAGITPEIRWSRISGDKHGSWKGGRIKLSGYWGVLLERGSPFMSMCTTGNGYVLEHRLVVAQALGRPLRSDETVHHINGDRTDNRIENLQLRQGRHGRGAVARCSDCGSSNIAYVPLADVAKENVMTTAQENLDMAKSLCVEGESLAEHAEHAAELEAAYLAFAGDSESNPAAPGETHIAADIAVQGGAGLEG